MTFAIAGLPIGRGHPARVIAEVGNAHNGDFTLALRLLDGIKAAGADFAKFQCYSPEELIALRGDGPAPEPWGAQGETMASLYERAMTPREWFPTLVDHCRSIGLPWFSSVFGAESLALLESLDCPAYKLAALDCRAPALRRLMLRTDRPIIRSYPDTDAPTRWPDSRTLYCPPGYPQPKAMLQHIRNGYDGYSYHGTDPTVPTFAVIAGAHVVEVHVQLDDAPSALESEVSLTVTQLAVLVRAIRRAEAVMA